MNVLVCVKRVPETGGRVTLTDDAQDIDTRYLGFTVSPHEECAAEEAVRIVEAHGGSSTVLTLGPTPPPTSSATRWRSGSTGRSCSRPTDATGTRSRPPARSSTRSGPRPRPGTAYDLLLFGNEAADSGDYQVGDPGGGRPRPALHQRGQVARDPRWDRDRPARGRRRLGGLRGPAARGRLGPRGDQPAPLPVRAGAAPGEEEGDRPLRARDPTGRTDQAPAAPAGRTGAERRDPRDRTGGRPGGRRAASSGSGWCRHDPRLRRARRRDRRTLLARGAHAAADGWPRRAGLRSRPSCSGPGHRPSRRPSARPACRRPSP